MKYRAVLDASAVAAYASGSIHVGEVLGEIADEDDALVALPVASLIQAHVGHAEPAMLDLLTGLTQVVPLPLDVDDWKRTAAATTLLAGLDRACAALLVSYGAAQLLITRTPDAYGEGIPTIGV